MRELSADKAYSTHDNHDVLDRLGVAAYIPFKDNAVVNLKFPVWSRHLCEFLLHQERFLPHYHRRSNVETVFAMIKAKFGADVRSRLVCRLGERTRRACRRPDRLVDLYGGCVPAHSISCRWWGGGIRVGEQAAIRAGGAARASSASGRPGRARHRTSRPSTPCPGRRAGSRRSQPRERR